MSGEIREMAGFLAMVVDITTKTNPFTLTKSGICFFRKGCHGIIKSAIKPNKQDIHWYCPECENEGNRNAWRYSKSLFPLTDASLIIGKQEGDVKRLINSDYYVMI